MTSSIVPPRNSLAEEDPKTHLIDSVTFDLPQPFGPTMPANCASTFIVVGSTNVLKPANLISLSFNCYQSLDFVEKEFVQGSIMSSFK
jgi:hypothetical protein